MEFGLTYKVLSGLDPPSLCGPVHCPSTPSPTRSRFLKSFTSDFYRVTRDSENDNAAGVWQIACIITAVGAGTSRRRQPPPEPSNIVPTK
ncbi:hypothetical protein EVAR_36398_1 [Eumeta japonica]|uniref:Uncharacterized protein n=1 Tax=Eumeta variegata TaxID=151549 RepID=A0A4C1W8E3_EUMVA|nr:hypothetical protein EVAR_36398_1 [Eumeta japonica]